MVRRFSVAAVVVLISGGCAGSAANRTSREVPRSPVWVRATAQQEGIDLRPLDRADLRGITSLLVARHGKLVVERYYGGLRAADRVPVFSITKTVVSALTGIAIAEGRIRSVDERLAHFVPSAPRAITLRQLLTMTAGYGRSFNFQDTNPATLANRSLANRPGGTFVYDSGSSDLLAAVLARATGMPAAEYARRRLFGPMGISGERWPSSRGGSGLILRPRDLLAFGQMYLDGGTWNARRIVPAAWVRASTRAQVDVGPGQGIYDKYGYNWWVDDRELQLFAAHGYLGQVLVVVPRLDEVVLVTSSREDGRTYGLVRLVVRATRRD